MKSCGSDSGADLDLAAREVEVAGVERRQLRRVDARRGPARERREVEREVALPDPS